MARRRRPENEALSKRVQLAFGRRLQERRRASVGKNQETLALALDVTRTSISNIERGRHRVFLDQAYLAAKTLGVPLADLLPSVDDVFSENSVVLAPNAGLGQNSVMRVSEIAQSIQQTAAGERLAEKPKAHRKRR